MWIKLKLQDTLTGEIYKISSILINRDMMFLQILILCREFEKNHKTQVELINYKVDDKEK